MEGPAMTTKHKAADRRRDDAFAGVMAGLAHVEASRPAPPTPQLTAFMRPNALT